jgi:hypothetical protein
MLLEKKDNTKIYVLEYIRYKQVKWYGNLRRTNEERLLQKIFGVMSTWKKKERKILKFMDTGSNNWNEREGN